MLEKIRPFDEIRDLLVSKYHARELDPGFLVGGAIENDEQLPFKPNHLLTITNPAVLMDVFEINPHEHLKSIRSMWDNYGIDEQASQSAIPTNELSRTLFDNQHSLGIRCSVAFCVVNNQVVGYRIFGHSYKFQPEFYQS